MPLLFKLGFRRLKYVFCEKGPMCFYQSSICLLKIVHHNYLRENQVPVDNLMLLLLRRKMSACTFWDLF